MERRLKKRTRKVRAGAQRNTQAFQQGANEGIAPSRFRKHGYMVVGVAERDMPRFDREQAMAESRRLVENDPFVAGIVQCVVDNVVRDGFRLVMNTDDKGWNKEVESAWDESKDYLDVRQIRPFWKLQRCWQYRKMVDGDVGIYHNYLDPNLDKLYVQTIEADRIRSKKFDYLDQGVEFDDLGMPLRYWIGPRPKDQQDIQKQLAQGTAVAAEDFFLYAHYPTERADQLRGVSMLLPMFNTLKDIREMMEAMLQKLKVAAFFALKSVTKAGPQGLDWNGSEKVKQNEDSKKRRTRALVPMSIADLAQDEDLSEIESKSPNPEFEKFVRFTIRYAGAQLGLPLEFALFDVGSLNYSSMLAIREMAKRRFVCEQESLKVPSSKVFRSWINHMMDIGKLKAPKGLLSADRAADQLDGKVIPNLKAGKHIWLPPPWPSLDAQKDVQAYGMALGYGLTTIKDVLAQTSNRTFDELVAQRQEEVKALKKAVIPVNIGLPGSNQAGNPQGKSASAEDLDTEGGE